MLNVIVGRYRGPDYIHCGRVYFDNKYKDEWLEEDFVKDIIRDIDQSELRGHCVISPILGQIPITDIAGGTKTVILMKYLPEKIYNGSSCGENCAKWIIEAAKDHDVTIRLGYPMPFDEVESFKIRILNTGEIATTPEEFFFAYMRATEVPYEG